MCYSPVGWGTSSEGHLVITWIITREGGGERDLQRCQPLHFGRNNYAFSAVITLLRLTLISLHFQCVELTKTVISNTNTLYLC